MPKIVHIEPVSPAFAITWNIGLYCNFDCMYCPSQWHNKTSLHKTLAEFKAHWQEILDKTSHLGQQYKISFTGGEPTSNKSFLEFLIWLDDNYGNVLDEMGFTTNGSASKQYYLDAINIPSVSYISFSTHSEFFNELKFFETVTEVNIRSNELGKTMHVNVMNEYWNKERNAVYVDYLKNNNIPHSLNEVNYTALIRSDPVTNQNKKLFVF